MAQYVIAFLTGMAIDLIVWFLVQRKRTCGVLKIDHSDPEKDIYRLDVGSIDDLPKRRYITLKIEDNADLR